MENQRVLGFSILGVFGLLLFFSPPGTLAGPVTWQIAGEISHVSDPLNLLEGAVSVGTPFFWSYTFESTTQDSNPGTDQGIYNSAIIALSGNVGGVVFDGPHAGRFNQIRVDNSPRADLYLADVGVEIAGVVLDLSLGFSFLNGNAFDSDGLPTDPFEAESIQTAGFGIGDTEEVVPLVLGGRVTTVVTEPFTIGLLAIGSFAAFFKPSRRANCRMAIRSRLLFLVYIAATATGKVTLGEDCNGNGISDSIELLQCKVDIVFLMDTSTSMPHPRVNQTLCSQAIPGVVTALANAGVLVNSEVRRISPDVPGTGFTECISTCCDSSVVETYGMTTPGMPETLADCVNEEGKLEDWGVAAAIVAGNKSWTSNALRVIIPMSDEPPRCGWPDGDPSADCNDLLTTYHALTILSGKHVIMFPIVLDANSPFAQMFAESGQRFGKVFAFNQSGLGGKIADWIRSNCGRDCNGNGMLDSCDIDQGTTPDCYAYSSDCCVVHSSAGCTDTTIQTCVCNLDSSCCDAEFGSWHSDCINWAFSPCGAVCNTTPDRVPDECQGSPDCNANGRPDICDVSCGTGQCGTPCGTSADCNSNCIPDDCEAANCSPSATGGCDCNGNGALDECDIATGFSCDSDGNSVPDECSACCTNGVCSNAVPQSCSGTSYSGFTCGGLYLQAGECGCSPRACCQGSQCQLIGSCDCISQGGVPAAGAVSACSSLKCSGGPTPGAPCINAGTEDNCGTGGICALDTNAACAVGSCCMPNGQCRDARENNGSPMTSTACTALTGGIFVGGMSCKGGRCQVASCLNYSCATSADCCSGSCSGTEEERSQPSPCSNFAVTLPQLLPPLVVSGPLKNRVISMIPRNSGIQTAIQVTLNSLNHPLPARDSYANPESLPTDFVEQEAGLCCEEGAAGCVRWVGTPVIYAEYPDNPNAGSFSAARLQCTPVYRDWGTAPIQVHGAEILPSSRFDVRVFDASCQGSEQSCSKRSCMSQFGTGRWGDVAAPFHPIYKSDPQPDALDIVGVLNRYKHLPNSGTGVQFKLHGIDGADVAKDVDALDLVMCLDAYKWNRRFPFMTTHACQP